MIELAPQIVDIASHNYDGVGTAKLNDKQVIIPGVLVGERIKLKVIKRSTHKILAEIDEILVSSLQRQSPPCDHYSICGGCQLQHMSYGYQLELKQKIAIDTLQSIAGFQPDKWLDPVSSNSHHYRRKARLSVKYVEKKGTVVVGFREEKSHFVTQTKSCLVLEKPMDILPSKLSMLFNKLSIKNKITAVELAKGDNNIGAVIRVLEMPTEKERELMRHGFENLGIQASLLLNTKEIVPLSVSQQDLRYKVGDINISFLPQDFIQVNAYVNQSLITSIINYVNYYDSKRVLDLFCGLGNITLPLAKYVETAVGVDVDFGLISRAKANAKNNLISNVDFKVANLFKGMYPIFDSNWDTLIIDPPRSGAENVISQIHKMNAKVIIYVSCNPGTFARDAKIICHDHGYRLIESKITDMFPMTHHIEIISLFIKKQ
jgi:23S rRNA (uracil1939-C5)-methyltransferase